MCIYASESLSQTRPTSPDKEVAAITEEADTSRKQQDGDAYSRKSPKGRER